jgi:Flp pilus assembly pilin Flp
MTLIAAFIAVALVLGVLALLFTATWALSGGEDR